MKIAYNETTKIEKSIAKSWYRNMMDQHIPAVMKTGCFESYRFMQLTSLPDEDGYTFSVQYIASSRENLQHFFQCHAPIFGEKLDSAYKGKYVAFTTVMNILDENSL